MIMSEDIDFQCDSCGKIKNYGIAREPLFDVVFVACEDCYPLIPDIKDEVDIFKEVCDL